MSFSATLWKYTTREVRRRPGRTALTLAGIVIGVATVVAITATTRATRRSYQNMFEEIGGKAGLEIVAPGQGGFDPAPVLDALRRSDVVHASVGLIQTRAGLLGKGGITPVLVLGIDPEHDRAVRGWDVVEGRFLDSDGALLEANFARENRLGVGDDVRLGAETGLGTLKIVGLLRASGPALFNGGAVVVMPLASARRLFRLPGQVNSVQIVLKPGVSADNAREEIEKTLPAELRQRVQVQSPAARAALARGAMMSTEQALSAMSVVSLVGGGFVILNSFLMNLGERRRQLAILRALGATRRQVTRLLLREAVMLGVVGTLLGVGAGVVLARGLVKMQEQLLGVRLPPLDFGAEPFVLALLFGPGLSLVATIVPAWQAGRRSPLEAMRPRRSTPEPADRRAHWPRWLGLLLLMMCLSIVFGGVQGWWSPEMATTLLAPAMMLVLIGSVLLLPAVLTPLLSLTRQLLRPLFGPEGAIALRQLERQHTRTALTSGVLFIGVMVTIGFGSSLLNSIHDIDVWYRGTIPADFLVRGLMPDGGTVWASPLGRELREELKMVEGVDGDNVGRITFIPVQVEGRSAILLARDYPRDRGLAFSLVEGSEEAVRAGLLDGEVVLGTPLAHRLGVGVGGLVAIKTREGEKTLRVAGLVKEYTVGGMALYLDWDMADRLFVLPGVNAFEVYAASGQHAVAETALKQFGANKGLLVQSNVQVRAVVDGAVASVEGFLWVLIALVFVVAALGIVNTLTMNVIEQTRELGVLRAIGLRRGQVRKLVVAQATAMGLLSVLPGVLGGLGMAWLMNEATYPFSGHRVVFAWRPGFVAGCALTALTVAILAALLPARRAARLRIIEALHYE